MVVPVQLFRKNLRFQTLLSCLCMWLMASLGSGARIKVPVTIIFEEPYSIETTQLLKYKGIETFDYTDGLLPSVVYFNNSTDNKIVGRYLGDYTLSENGQWGGVYNHVPHKGHYMKAQGTVYIQFPTIPNEGLNAFGLLWSGVEERDKVEFVQKSKVKAVVTGSDIERHIGNLQPYHGPNQHGWKQGHTRVFVTLILGKNSFYDEIRLHGSWLAPFESDQHTPGRTFK